MNVSHFAKGCAVGERLKITDEASGFIGQIGTVKKVGSHGLATVIEFNDRVRAEFPSSIEHIPI